MFNNISWQSYWLALAITVASYYLVVLLFLYKGVALRAAILQHRKYYSSPDYTPGTPPVKSTGQETSVIHSLSSGEDFSDFENPATDSLEYTIYACMDELTAYFEEAKAVKCNKEDVLHALKRILDKYPAIDSSEYKASVAGIISAQCESICSIHLSEGDVHGVWLKG